VDKMLNNLQIREIRAEDSDDIGRIQALITKESMEFDFEEIIKEYEHKNRDVSLVAEIDGKVVGFMASYVIRGAFGIEKSAWIAMFGVDPKFMGQGIGIRLAEEILKVYREKGVKHVFTSVRWDSVDLLSFFKTLGFDRSNFINLYRELDF